MVKKLTMIALAMLLTSASALARPATKGIVNATQPDGTTVGLRLIGDEYHHYNTTSDGYALVKDARGYYVYAQLNADGRLVPTTLIAHDAEARSAQELAFLQQTGRLTPQPSKQAVQLKQQNAASRRKALAANRANRYNYANFKGLVILVEYNDCQFTYDNYSEIMSHMINDDNYTGTNETNFNDFTTHRRITCTGSMRDYFRDSSNGIFVPTFDIVGPVQINRSQYYSGVESESDPDGKGLRSMQLMIDACTAADSQVNFKDYDTDNDGVVDMIYFIFSGLPSYIQGNDPRLLWPHQSDLSYMRTRKDGVRLGRYACSTELFGYQDYNWSVLEGIGTMCHEFSHVLGLPDFYDTGNQYDGTCVDPGEWSVMANGADFETGRRPCGYSLFERYALGFATPQLITEPGHYELEDLSQSNAGYRIDTPQKNEYFILENRQLTKWDAKLPGHGMLVFRVDSTNVYAWEYNSVNDDPDHPYYEVVRAKGPQTSYYGTYGAPSDPFPGTGNVSNLDNLTTPASLRSWAGKNCALGLSSIAESNSGVISFDVFDANVLTSISLNEEVMLGVGTTLQLTPVRIPDYAPYELVWSCDNEQVVTVSEDGLLTGVSEGVAHVTVTANGTLSATCTVIVRDMPIVANIAAFIGLDNDSEALLMLTDAEVLYVNKSDIYLRDATGSIILDGTNLDAAKNDVINGSVYGRKTLRNNMPVLSAVDQMTTNTGIVTTQGDEVQPVNLHISQLSPEYYANMVTLEKVELKSDGGIYAFLGEKRYRLFNTLKISNIKVPTDLKKRYDVTAIFGTNTVNGQVIDELYLLKSPTAVSYTALTGISLPATLQLPVDRTYQMEAVLTPSKADVFLRWTSSNEQVATIDQNGTLVALANGTATITVTNLDNGLSAECLLTVGDKVVKQSIADFKTLAPGNEAELTLTDAQVVYVYKTDAYLRDATGAIRLAGTGLSLKAGDLLNGHLYGRFELNDLVPELQPIEGSTNAEGYTVTSGTTVEPREFSVASLSENDYADLVVIRATQLSSVEGLTGLYAAEGDKYVRVYNTFGLSKPIQNNYAGKYFDLTGILITAKVGTELVSNLGLTQKATEVELPNSISDLHLTAGSVVDIYNTAGRLVARTTTDALRQMSLPGGIYILKAAGQQTQKIVIAK